jgi:hypothetical protein
LKFFRLNRNGGRDDNELEAVFCFMSAATNDYSIGSNSVGWLHHAVSQQSTKQ